MRCLTRSRGGWGVAQRPRHSGKRGQYIREKDTFEETSMDAAAFDMLAGVPRGLFAAVHESSLYTISVNLDARLAISHGLCIVLRSKL